MNLFECQKSRISGIADSARSGRPMNLESGRTATHVLQAVANELGEAAILVRVPRDLDKSAYVPLVIARQCGPDFARQVGDSLATNPAAALEVLSGAVSHKFLLVDGASELYRPALDWDLSGVLEPRVKPVREWLEKHAAVSTRSVRGTSRAPVSEEPRPDRRWAANLLWYRVEQDPDRYALAVARQLLWNPPEEAELGWDTDAIISDLWQWMPSDLRDLVRMLATHHRPVFVEDLERLGVSSRSVIDMAIGGYLVEHQRDQLWLPSPWYTIYPDLELPEIRQNCHRRWAQAFSRQVHDEGGPAALAVLEAHRHYALIPDVPRARQFARYGTGVLLETAVRQSKAGRYDDAASTYQTVLEFAKAAGPDMDARARAYAIHYLHFNRARHDAESLAETQRGYGEALELWPENALFWSRLIRSNFLARDEASAMAALARAWELVPEHPERKSTLVVRTVDRLLERKLVLPALFVWDNHMSESGFDAAVEAKLIRELTQGTSITRLWAPGLPAMDVLDPVRVRVDSEPEPVFFRCVAGTITVRGVTRMQAVKGAIRALIVEALADRWYRETGHKSVLGNRFHHPAWQQIVALGLEVVPDILRRIERTKPSHLHHALAAITGENPLPSGARATVADACEAWLTWGREHGYRW